MKRIKYVILVALLLVTFNVNAKVSDNCDKNEFARLKELAKKVEFDYDYKMVNGKAIFSINAINLNRDLKVLIIENYYNQKYKEFKNDGNNRGSLDGFSEGERVTVTINAFVPNWCSGKKVYTKTVKLPYYNKYYSEEKCKGNEGFKYCKQLIDTNISEKTFNSELTSYIRSREKSEVKSNEKENNTLKYIIIGGISLVVAIGAATLVIHNVSRIRKKNSL